MDFETVRALVHPEDREALYSTVDVELEGRACIQLPTFGLSLQGGEVRTVACHHLKALERACPGDPGQREIREDQQAVSVPFKTSRN